MNIVIPLRLGLTVAALAIAGGAPARGAQFETVQQASPGADELATQMRALAANPNDVVALIRAGELALDLGDQSAAARFFARAERIDPRNGRLKAGTARTLLMLERPGEALRLFDEAERLGYEPVHYAAERGLAFDLVGEQQRAQRDYRLALKQAPDDETTRRYALSLGISGRKDQALAQIDTLLRRSDRPAWRVRAFVLAMSGDVAGAERIATSMLPPDMAGGLIPFFTRLPSLGAVDRAFAVHFGEVAPTPARIADARLTPAYPPLPPEPVAPIRVAAAAAAKDPRADRRNQRRRGRDAPIAVAAVVPPPVAFPAAPPTARYVTTASMRDQQAPARTKRDTAAPPPSESAVAAQSVTVPPPAQPPVVVARPVVIASAPLVIQPRPSPLVLPYVVPAPAAVAAVATAPAPIADQVPAVASTPTPTTVAQAVAPLPEAAAPPPAVAAAPMAGQGPAPVARPVASEESILARIVATIAVPAAELNIAAAGGSAKPPAISAVAARAKSETPVLSEEEKKAAAKAAAKKAAEKKLADKKLAEKKAAEKLAAEEAAAAKKAAKAEPSRIWVQVAGGANVADLPKEWARLRGKAGALLANRQAWTTPLRFTNRLLTGPFKSGDEAQGFVNQMGKSGLTGFVFTSDAGQKVARLPGK